MIQAARLCKHEVPAFRTRPDSDVGDKDWGICEKLTVDSETKADELEVTKNRFLIPELSVEGKASSSGVKIGEKPGERRRGGDQISPALAGANQQEANFDASPRLRVRTIHVTPLPPRVW